MEGQIVFPHIERLRRRELGSSLDRAGLCEDDLVEIADADGAQIVAPVETGNLAVELSDRGRIVELVDLPRLRLRPVGRRDLLLEIVDALRLGGRIGNSRQLEHVADMRDVFPADFDETRLIDEIVIAVGQPEPALAEIARIDAIILEIEFDPHADRYRNAHAVELGECLGKLLV